MNSRNPNDLLKENQNLIHEKDKLSDRLNEALEVIDAIRKGNIDAVFTANNETGKVLVSKTADQSYRRFIENMSEGIVTLHPDGIIIYSNSGFAKMVDVPLKRVIGTNIRNFIPVDHIEIFERFFYKNPENNSKVELSVLNSRGIRTYFTISLNTLQLQDFVALNLVWTDVTDQKKAEEKLIAINESLKIAIAERIVSEKTVSLLNGILKKNIETLKNANIELATFAHIASHDLQEPLRKIITYGSILTTDYFNVIDERGQKYINNMQLASERMRNLINDILEYSLLSQKDFEFKPVSIQAVVKEIISNLEIVINETKAKIKIEKELPVIEANSSQMRQLFQNLISNALKFVKPNVVPEINITYEIVKGKEIETMNETKWNERFCIFYIRDSGIGFKQEYIDKMFTIFQKLNSSSAYQGTGIGLAICKKIVETHNGFISAEGKLNEGSLFTIILPVSHTGRRKRKQKAQSQYRRVANA